MILVCTNLTSLYYTVVNINFVEISSNDHHTSKLEIYGYSCKENRGGVPEMFSVLTQNGEPWTAGNVKFLFL